MYCRWVLIRIQMLPVGIVRNLRTREISNYSLYSFLSFTLNRVKSRLVSSYAISLVGVFWNIFELYRVDRELECQRICIYGRSRIQIICECSLIHYCESSVVHPCMSIDVGQFSSFWTSFTSSEGECRRERNGASSGHGQVHSHQAKAKNFFGIWRF